MDDMRTQVRISLLAALAILAGWASPAHAFTNDTYFRRECKGTSGCSFQWGLDRVGAEYAWSVSEGQGTLIGVIDSGVDLDHADLQDQLVQGADFVGNGTGPTDNDPNDEHGHGTFVAGIAAASTGNGIGIASVAPKARILPVRVFGADATATAEDVIQGINYAVDRADDLNMSLVLNLSFEAAEDENNNKDPLGSLLNDPGVDGAIKNAAEQGAAVVIASGNESRATTTYNAPDDKGILVAGASDTNDSRLSLSNYGAGLDLLAPGIDITTTGWNPEQGSGYAITGGTSMAVPFVAGAAALLMANGMSNVQAANRILETARDLGDPGRDDQTGHGLLDVAAAFGVQRPGNARPPTKPPSTKPSPPPSPSPLVLPSPGPPVPLVQPAGDPSQSVTGAVAASGPPEEPPDPPLKPIAAALVGVVGVMHVVRKLLLA